MSQLTTAEELHQKAAHELTGLQRRAVELQEKTQATGAEQLSKEAYDAEAAEIADSMDRVDKDFQRAAKLAELAGKRTFGQNQAEQAEIERAAQEHEAPPEHLRRSVPREVGSPMGQGQGQGVEKLMSRDHSSTMTPGQVQRCSTRLGVSPEAFQMPTEVGRALLTRALRAQFCSQRGEAESVLERIGGPITAQELVMLAGMNTYVARDGGFLRGVAVSAEVISKIRDFVNLSNAATTQTISEATLRILNASIDVSLKPLRQHTGKVDGSGPVDIHSWLGKTEFSPQSSGETIKIPEDYFRDTLFDVLGFMTSQIAEKKAQDEESKFITNPNGTAVGLLDVDLAGVDHTGSSNADFTPEDIQTIPIELRGILRQGAAWLAPRAFVRRARILRDDAGGAGTGQFFFGNLLYSPGASAGDPGTLNGDPLLESEHFPNYHAAGSAGDPLAVYGQLSNFWIVRRGTDLEVRILSERYADDWAVGVRYTSSVDSSPVRREPFVTLDRT